MKKFLKIITALAISLLALVTTGFFAVYFSAKSVDVSNLTQNDNYVYLSIVDENENLIDFQEDNHAEFSAFNANLVNAFIAMEDANFFSHDGIDYKGILRALVSNVKNFSYVEGGSTITQQLAKNVYLSQDKKIIRKIKEMSIAKKIEDNFTKEEIFSAYLNKIYFGDNKFGIVNASKHYFNKNLNELSLGECATLASIIQSPSNFAPTKDLEKANRRKNLVLERMYECGFIDEMQLDLGRNTDIQLNIGEETKKPSSTYVNYVLKEASELLGIDEKELISKNYKISTYFSPETQNHLNIDLFNSLKTNGLMVAMNNENSAVKAISEKGHNVLYAKRQPASLIKPLIVYSPALNENIISAATQLKDEKKTFGNYSPSNFGNIYYGHVSARFSLAKSLNVPAVEIFNSLTANKGKMYGEKLGLTFSELDTGLSLALGGLNLGVPLKNIADAYTVYPNCGKFQSTSFIRKIDLDGKIVFKRNFARVEVFSSDAAYLTTDILRDSIKIGTASKLKDVPGNLAGKTGTNGNANGNFDAYFCGFNPETTFLCWIGNLTNEILDEAIKGSTTPTLIAKEFFQKETSSKGFEKPKTVVKCNYDALTFEEKGVLMLADESVPKHYVKSEIFSMKFAPKYYSQRFSSPTVKNPRFNVDNEISISFFGENHLIYEIYNMDLEKLATLSGGNSEITYFPEIAGKFYDKFYVLPINKFNTKFKGVPFVTDKVYFFNEKKVTHFFE